MDISFQTSAGDGTWSLEKCAAWASEHDFDCVRLADRGALDSNRILTEGPDKVLETLNRHGLYLACVTSHCNLLDDREEVSISEQNRLIRAIESAALLGCPVVVTGSGAPVMNGRFYGTYSYPPGNQSDRSDELVETLRGHVRAGGQGRGGQGYQDCSGCGGAHGEYRLQSRDVGEDSGRCPLGSPRIVLRSLTLGVDDDYASRRCDSRVRRQVVLCRRKGLRNQPAYVVPPRHHRQLVVAVPRARAREFELGNRSSAR